MRGRLGLAPVASAAQQLTGVDRILVTTSRAFDPWPESLPANVRYVGPQRQHAAQFTAPLESKPPLVVISLSTRSAAARLAQRILDALADLPVRALLTLGPALQPDQVRPPRNTTITSFVEHSIVLPRASLVITHAGLGTIMAALAHGVPLLCMPLKADQFENAARVVALGAGQQLSRHATSAQLRRATLQVLTKPHFRRAAQHLGEALAGEPDADPIAELEALARGRPAAAQRGLRTLCR